MPGYSSIINAIPGDPGANSYVTVDEATQILTVKRQYADTWLTPTPPTAAHDSFLIWATAFLDKIVEWNGYKATREQALRWPRSACFDPDGFYVMKDTIPQQVKDVVAQLAWEFKQKYRMVEPATLGLGLQGAVKVGPIQVNIQPNNYIPFIPMYLRVELGHWGILNGMGEGGMQQVKLVRA